MNMEYINKGLVAKATEIIPKNTEDIRSIKWTASYIFKMLFGGEHYMIMFTLAAIIIIFSLKNNYEAQSTGQALENHGDGFFIILAGIAAMFHALDLIWAWSIGELIIITPAVTNSTLANVLCAMLFGAFAGLVLLTISQFIRRVKIERIERRAFYRHMHQIGRKN